MILSQGTEREGKKMRIGRTIIDTDNMEIDELNVIINELREIRKRKQEAENMLTRMRNLLFEAKENGFDFVDKDFGNILTPDDFKLYDNR